MSDERPNYLNEDGTHVRLDMWLEHWDGWDELVQQLSEATGRSRQEMIQYILLCDVRSLQNGVTKLIDVWNRIARVKEAQHAQWEATREEREAAQKERDELQRQQVALGERIIAMHEPDTDEPWQQGG